MTDSNTHYVRFQRSNYVVSNLEQAITFYRDALGFSVDMMEDSDEDSYSYEVFQIDRAHKIRWAVLSTADQPRVMALTEAVGATLSPVPPPSRSAIVLQVGDVDLVVNKAKALGCHVYKEEELVTHDGRVGREVGLLDFDGNLSVIYYIPKKDA